MTCWGMSGSGARTSGQTISPRTSGRRGTASAPRVIRGGSWNSEARYVRAACRHVNEPAYRDNGLGVRFCEFGEPSVVSQAEGKRSERGSEAAGGGAPGDRDQASGAGARYQPPFFRTRRALSKRSGR